MMNKKIIMILIGIALTSGICITGCSSGKGDSQPTDQQRTQEEQTDSASEGQEQRSILTSFEAEALDGSAYTQDDLAQKDVTVMNFWSTMCGPCIEEMPDIATFAKTLPENVEMLTVCLDGSDNMEMVNQILEEAGYEGRTLVSGTGDFLSVCEAIQYTPTTVVVDQNGDMIGDVLIGGQEDLEKVYTEMVNNALESMGKAGIGDGTN